MWQIFSMWSTAFFIVYLQNKTVRESSVLSLNWPETHHHLAGRCTDDAKRHCHRPKNTGRIGLPTTLCTATCRTQCSSNATLNGGAEHLRRVRSRMQGGLWRKDVYWRTCASRQSYRVLTRNPLFAASLVTVGQAQAVRICSVMRHTISRPILAPSFKTHLLGGVLWSLFGPVASVYDLWASSQRLPEGYPRQQRLLRGHWVALDSHGEPHWSNAGLWDFFYIKS